MWNGPAFLLTFAAWLLTNIPLLLVIWKYESDTALTTILLAPNQFLFLLFFFPAGVYLTIRGAQLLGSHFVQSRQRRGWRWSCVGVWLFVITASAVFTYLDYQSSEAPDLYQLKPAAADDAVLAANVVLTELQNPSRANQDVPLGARARLIASSAKDGPSTGELMRSGDSATVTEAARFLFTVGNIELQRKHDLTDPTLRASNAVELFVAVVGLMHLLVWTIVLFVLKLARTPKDPIQPVLVRSARHLAVAVAFLSVFAFGSAFNVRTRELLFGSNVVGGARADVFAAIGFVVLATLLAIVFLRGQWLDIGKVAMPLIFGTAAYVFVISWHEVALDIFGPNTNPAIIFLVSLVCVVVVGSSTLLALIDSPST